MIPRLYRFHGHGSLRYVYSNGKAVRTPIFTLKYVKNDRRRDPRFSVVVSKKVLKSAIGRNRIRRRVYEFIRLALPRLSGVYDVVIICTSAEVRSMPAADLTDQLVNLYIKAGLYADR